MCLLAVMHRIHPEARLVVAANRDEALSRPALSMTVLKEQGPRILGGRDLQAGGTWLAVNEHGVLAGLTNRPSPQAPPAPRSRGELPLALATHASAAAAVASFCEQFSPDDFAPGWLLVGDRQDLFSLDMTGGPRPQVTTLPAGIHVLENRPPGTRSPKVEQTTSALREALPLSGGALREHLGKMLSSHLVPPGAGMPMEGQATGRESRHQTACVHAGPYGTRSALIALIGHQPRPQLWSADGPQCRAPLEPVSDLWTRAPAG
jgi:uncharacterized protein with NRDE domain